MEEYNSLYSHDFIYISETYFDSTILEGDKSLNIEKVESIFCNTGDETDPLLPMQKNPSKHPTILRIKQYFKDPAKFSFVPVNKDV